MNQTRETIAVEGGAEEEARRQHRRQERVDDLLFLAVRYIPQRHRIGWLHALARRYATPLSATPTPAELAYIAWSEARHTSPRQGSETNPAYAHAQSLDNSQASLATSKQSPSKASVISESQQNRRSEPC